MKDLDFTSKDKEFLVALLSVKGVGRKTARNLLFVRKKCNLSRKEFWLNKDEILRQCGVRKNSISRILKLGSDQNKYSKYKRLEERKIRVISFWENEYPPLLREAEDFPLLLFAVGNYKLLTKDTISIVGTRKVTAYGRLATNKIVRDLVEKKYVVVSGFMFGVDLVAHLSAIKNGGETIGVLGFGFDYMYPDSHRPIFRELLDKGACFVTEYFPETEVARHNFPERNRIVAGISKGVVVVEAAARSGTHITARCAIEEGREVFAVPGPYNSPYSEGTKWLINQGAKLITSGEDVVAEFRN